MSTSVQEFKIFGERNTSTNAVEKVLRLNFNNLYFFPSTSGQIEPRIKEKINLACQGLDGFHRLREREKVIDSVFKECGLLTLWKHCALNFDDFSSMGDTKFIITVRHPVSWLIALHKRPYHKLQRIEENFKDFVVQPWQTVERERLGCAILTPIQLWNEKVGSYLRFLEEVSFRNNIYFVKFEDFARSQEEALKDVLNAIGGIHGFKELNVSAKGDDRNVHWYRNYYGNEVWRREIEDEAFRIIEERIDKRLLSIFNYEI
ncbi:hypothetical protein EKK97_12790 [Billgrantia tianxiuensis]|uniref:Sulfotransferase family protein n=1 Tax=Billgrantia tianxiuensis TaxID=2497861 RepID=A0A6I6SP94_9GAMM|nr:MULTISPECIES: hypothetical protein [Halomonas]MCE8031557.1 hypothetical protein [Halomonas sp. MCCC 1A11057]QHC50284.1 hypothetical protein EKK97_12790 [Halomonas tianxiuensis]